MLKLNWKKIGEILNSDPYSGHSASVVPSRTKFSYGQQYIYN